MTFDKIAIFGAGATGSGIAFACATAGAAVSLCDPSPEAIKRAQKHLANELKKLADREVAEAARERIEFQAGLGDCEGVQLVVEAVSGKVEVKRELVSRLDGQAPPPAVIATSTRSISITTIAAAARFPDRVCGLHFFQPYEAGSLVEIVTALQTNGDVVERCARFAREIGKVPVRATDAPGFLVTRCMQPFFDEALCSLERGLADPDVIDKIFSEAGFTSGAFAMLDQEGIDAHYTMTRTLWEASHDNPRFRPHLLLRRMAAAGKLGRKAGRGFYEYGDVE